jgi:micrococcal nuclease
MLPRRFRRPISRLLLVVTSLATAASIRSCQVAPDAATSRNTWTIQTVHDGDTVTAVTPTGQTERIRLLGIDAPEYHQPYGREARTTLNQKLRSQPLRIEAHGRDQYNRLLGVLWIGPRNINQEMVTDGAAWVFDRGSPPAELLQAERAARQAQRGLWSAANPIRPAEWRMTHPRTP